MHWQINEIGSIININRDNSRYLLITASDFGGIVMWEKLLLAATLTLALSLFTQFKFSTRNQTVGEVDVEEGQPILTLTQLHR
jgi:hypothetical protein